MFENSLKLVDDAGLTQLHVFPFSPRTGTPAARMPQLGAHLAKARGARLRAKGDAARSRAFPQPDRRRPVRPGGKAGLRP